MEQEKPSADEGLTFRFEFSDDDGAPPATRRARLVIAARQLT